MVVEYVYSDGLPDSKQVMLNLLSSEHFLLYGQDNLLLHWHAGDRKARTPSRELG